jgi:ribonuclease BN (tRNA processing enzyme)
MELRILGAHNQETAWTRLTTLLVDGVLALDAGGLTGSLSLAEQGRLQGVLLTHRHYDHLRDLPALAINTFDCGQTLPVYGLPDTLLNLQSHLLDGALYPDFTVRPSPQRPRLRLHSLDPLRALTLHGYQVLPVPVPHGCPALGFQVASPGGPSVFYTGDTGPGLAAAWSHCAPDLLVVEVTLPSRLEAAARQAGHLTPALLEQELLPLAHSQGGLPSVLAIHMTPAHEEEIRHELERAAQKLGCSITLATEGMALTV